MASQMQDGGTEELHIRMPWLRFLRGSLSV